MNITRLAVTISLGLGLALPSAVWAQDPVPPPESLRNAFPENQQYSPYAGRNFPTRVFWGDTHQHTALSMDAGAVGAPQTPEDP